MSDSAATTIAGSELHRFASAEWLLTNGLGGFAMGTPKAIPQRRYHAWLIAAANPPVGRHVVLHSCAEWLVLPASATGAAERRIAISTYQFTGEVQSPDGATLLQSFTRGSDCCRWVYRDAATGISITRELALEQHVNRCSVKYTVQSAPQGARLEIRPFTPLRDFHTLEHTHEQPETRLTQGRTPDEIAITRGGLSVALRCAPLHARQSSPSFDARAEWWRNFSYTRDQMRGQEGLENLHSHGVWSVALTAAGAGNESGCTLTCEVTSPDLGDLRPPAAAPVAMPGSIPQALRTAASQFVVRRVKAGPQKGSQTSIIAGYPWFSDWGRDTCISLPGLLLATGRYAEARQCLEAFADMVEGGLVPNCFDNGSGHAEYNTADASLWYLNAAAELAKKLGLPLDPSGELSTIAGACLSIIHAYEHGTSFDIAMDPSDGLIIAGNAGTQLTWMDAKRDGVVFTPRHGKPVELSALWYNGLRRVGELLPASQARRAREIGEIAAWMDRSFEKAFWNEQGAHLFDCLAPRYASDGSRVGWEPSRQIRPNQIFALSLPYSPLERSMQPSVLDCVTRHLLTPQGLRTLSPHDGDYRPRFEGSLFARDGAYHNGTVWPWLIGPYAEAVLRVGEFSASARAKAREAIDPLLNELCRPQDPTGPIGQICEVYDAEMPRRPEGCPAQAWSVAELIRILVLLETPSGGKGG